MDFNGASLALGGILLGLKEQRFTLSLPGLHWSQLLGGVLGFTNNSTTAGQPDIWKRKEMAQNLNLSKEP